MLLPVSSSMKYSKLYMLHNVHIIITCTVRNLIFLTQFPIPLSDDTQIPPRKEDNTH